ncbi:MAG: hypothetical protein CLLPBCKN_006593 [Chroococcidiopsis cubana SAG 39.79]|nr:hypothetical protein [Chroococcidiopsis cubana]MDZ4877158.1 hypothetical protein [Chroococcidiopsis cubana SAG 39.79]
MRLALQIALYELLSYLKVSELGSQVFILNNIEKNLKKPNEEFKSLGKDVKSNSQ